MYVKEIPKIFCYYECKRFKKRTSKNTKNGQNSHTHTHALSHTHTHIYIGDSLCGVVANVPDSDIVESEFELQYTVAFRFSGNYKLPLTHPVVK